MQAGTVFSGGLGGPAVGVLRRALAAAGKKCVNALTDEFSH